PVVDVGEDAPVDGVDLRAQVLGVEVGGALAVVVAPLAGEVERHLGVVVGHHLAGGDVDDGGDGDPARVVREAGEVGLLQPLDAEHRVPAVRVEVEGPRALVVRRTGQPEGDDVLQAEQPPHDDGAVRPRAGAGRDQPVATRLHRVPVRAVTGDPGGDVVGVAGELLAGAHVRTRGGVLVHDPTVTR